MMPDRRTLLDHASRARIVMRHQDTPWAVRMKAKAAVAKIEVALASRAALGRMMGDQAAAEALIANLPYPTQT